ncbi:MAG: PEP-CTERM sorting domain-containing protein, partial [Chthoniobacterales bacterium]
FQASQLTHAQTLVDHWDYVGGAFNPATYGGAYRPPVLLPNAAENSGATLVLSNLASGGLGSNSFPQGYGGIYTFFSQDVGFAMQTANVLPGLQTISASFRSGGGVYGSTSLLLALNSENLAVASNSYSALDMGEVESPIGPVEMFQHTWTWDVASLGASTGFSLQWTGHEHEFLNEVSLTQAIPEPSTLVMLGLGGVLVLREIRRRARCRA